MGDLTPGSRFSESGPFDFVDPANLNIHVFVRRVTKNPQNKVLTSNRWTLSKLRNFW